MKQQKKFYDNRWQYVSSEGKVYKTIAVAIKMQNTTPDIAKVFSGHFLHSAVYDVLRLHLKILYLWNFLTVDSKNERVFHIVIKNT